MTMDKFTIKLWTREKAMKLATVRDPNILCVTQTKI